MKSNWVFGAGLAAFLSVPAVVTGTDLTVAGKDGAAVQKAIDAVAAMGGGKVVVPEGTYPCGTLHLRSHVELRLEKGAVLLGGDKPEAYEDVLTREGLYPENTKKVFIACEDCEDIAITGEGTVDGCGVSFYDVNSVQRNGFFKKPANERPRMVQFARCRNVRLQGVTFKDSPGWTFWLRRCADIEVSGIRVVGDQRMINNDGIDFDACRKAHVKDCFFQTADDCVIMRAIRGEDGEPAVCEDILVEDCHLDSRCQCIRIGCPSDDTCRNAVFRRITSRGHNAILSYQPYHYLSSGDRGYLRTENLLFEDWDIDCYGSPIFLVVEKGITLRDFGHFTFRNFKVKGVDPIKVLGCAESVIRDVKFENFTGEIAADEPIELRSFSGLRMTGFDLKSGVGEHTPFKGAVGSSWETAKKSEAGKMVIAERGKASDYTIVIPAEPAPSQKYAAEELRDWAEKLTGVKLPIATRAGKRAIALTLTDDYGADGFRLVTTKEGDVRISGGKRGVLYGVYEILETYGGIGWFASWHTVVPETGRLAVPSGLDDVQKPAFELRAHNWRDLFVNPDFAARLRKNDTGPFYGSRERSPQARHGGDDYRPGAGLGGCHTFNRLVPPEKYAKDHPEYFSEIRGVRRTSHTQLCLTNPDVLAIVVERILRGIREDPEPKIFHIKPNDWDNYCECANCKAVDEAEESHAGTLVRFANAVAERVASVFPGRYMCISAYQYTQKPPKLTKPRPDVIVDLAPIDCDVARPYGVNKTPANQTFAADLDAWAVISSKIHVWDYTANFNHPYRFFPNVYVLQPNMQYYRDHGVSLLFEEGNGQYHAYFAELKGWLISKLQWDPDQPIEPLLDRFFKGYYGKAAPFARACFDAEHAAIARMVKPRLGIFEGDRKEVYTDELVSASRTRWRQAEVAVKDDPRYLHNVRMSAFSAASMYMSRLGDSAKFIWVTRQPEKVAAPPADVQETYAWMCDRIREGSLDFNGSRFAHTTNMWERVTRFRRPSKGADRAFVGINDLFLDLKGEIGDEVADREAIGGRAFHVFNSSQNLAVKLWFGHVAFDAGAEYRLRVHVRAPRAKGARPDYEAFRTQIGELKKSFAVRDLKEGYAWYDAGVFKPDGWTAFYLASGRFSEGGGVSAVEGVWIDGLEIERVESTDKGTLALLSPAEGETVSLHTPVQEKFLKMSHKERAGYFVADRAPAKALQKGGDRPAKVKFSWQGGNGTYDVAIRRQGTTNVFFAATIPSNTVWLDSFEIARTYEWVVRSAGKKCRGTFKTEDLAPRLINVNRRVGNARDLGGRIGLDGRRVKQGLVFRTVGLNDNAKYEYCTVEDVMRFHKEGTLASKPPHGRDLEWLIKNDKPIEADKIRIVSETAPKTPGKARFTEGERKEFLARFGIRTDIDLRTDAECYGMTGSPLGPEVRWVHVSYAGYANTINADSWGKKAHAAVFREFLDPANYPIVFHCIGGADRTGTVAYLLNGLLGVEEDELYKDYEVTGFQGGITDPQHRKWLEELAAAIRKLPGKTIAEKLENYHLSLGFTKAEIEKFRSIMLESEIEGEADDGANGFGVNR